MATKLVNGVRVGLTAQEEADLQAEWAANAADTAIPAEITKVQFVRAMRAAGHWDTHSAAIEAHPDWPYITALPRNDALTLAAAAAIGATDAEMDAIWIAGAAL